MKDLAIRPWSREFIRIVSWNIERGLQFPRILEFLRTIEADLILLQEVDLNARRTHFSDIASELAQALNMNFVFGKEFQELSEGSQAFPAFQGQATLSPWPLSRGRMIQFRDQSNFWHPRWYVPELGVFQRRNGGRIALVAEASVYGRRLVAYNLHLESKGDDALRVRQLAEVLDDCRRYVNRPVFVIGGDFNLIASRGDAARLLREAGFHDAVRLHERPTTPVHGLAHHAHAIDWIFASEDLKFQGRVHDDVHGSDHYPVSMTVPVWR
ncbi:MAG TPA: endonuclease/exonuclease/phosphatase family protein [Candidatus Acidoferrales bacterium]|nr:endonuclease/exonuclease/phosphatase family protein [Candidatus Acidoferrales bacterium]